MTEQENSKTIEKQGRDWVEIVFEIIALMIIAVIVFIGGMYLFPKMCRFIPFWLGRLLFATLAGPFVILGFVVLLGVSTKWWRPKNNQLRILKKILYVSLFALSTSLLVHWYIIYLFEHVW
jgi:hypothetical protein